ncbi:carbon storage regulator [Microbulbifer sp. EKSA008]
MLILKRRTSEHLRIGASVSITVLEVKGIQVKIGIHARTPLPLQ